MKQDLFLRFEALSHEQQVAILDYVDDLLAAAEASHPISFVSAPIILGLHAQGEAEAELKVFEEQTVRQAQD